MKRGADVGRTLSTLGVGFVRCWSTLSLVQGRGFCGENERVWAGECFFCVWGLGVEEDKRAGNRGLGVRSACLIALEVSPCRERNGSVGHDQRMILRGNTVGVGAGGERWGCRQLAGQRYLGYRCR